MPKTKISEYSTTNSNNTDIQSINIDEGCAPSGINNAIRELMVHLKNFQTGASSDPLTVAGTFVASAGAVLSSTNTLSGANIISGNINSSGTNTFSGANVISGTLSLSTALGVASGGTGTTTLTGVVIGSGTSAFTAKTNPSGAFVGTTDTQTLTNKTLTAPVISTISNTGTLTLPTSTDTLVGRATTDTLTNKTISADNNTISGIAASSFVLSNASGNIDGSASQKAIPSGVVVGTTDTQTLTNKRVTPRVSTTTSSATPTINTDNVDIFGLTAQAADITSFTTNLSGTPTDGQKLWIYIVGTAARAITWGASFEASTVALPTTTVSTNRLDVGFVWNAATSKWRCVATA